MVKLKLNGVSKTIDADPNMPILWALRDILGMTGTKFGCGRGLCGACTIHLDGSPIRSCITPLSVAENKEVTTIEGLSENGDHPLQVAWNELNVPQCGYCQPGQLMSAAALLEQNKKPSDQDISGAMSGNICRCGTYPRIKAAIHLAADLAREVK